MIITSKLSNEALLKAIYKAAAEYSKLIGNSYLIIGKNKNTDYYGFQCYFEKKHFMHLLRNFHDAPYVMFCDQDAVWHPDKVRKTLELMQKIE